MNADFFGYRRENGRVGVRNHVLILPVDDGSNAAAEAISRRINGTLALPHACGPLEHDEDRDLFFRTLIGTSANPNVAACLVVATDRERMTRVAGGVAPTGKPVAGFVIDGGDADALVAACRSAKDFIQRASAHQRERCSVAELFVGVTSAEEDATSPVASDAAVGNLIDKLDTLGATTCLGQAPERQGDTSSAEKADGDIQKTGVTAKRLDVLKAAEAPSKGRGLYCMETPSAAAEGITLQAAAGFVVHLCPTGEGNAIGHPIVPVIKVTGNAATVRAMREHIDMDVSGLVRNEVTLHVVGDILLDLVLRTCSGRLTSAEVLGHREFAVPKVHQRA